MRKLRITCAQPVVGAWASLSTTNAGLPQEAFTNANLGKTRTFLPTNTTSFPTTSSQLILTNNSVGTAVFPTIPRPNKNNNKGE